VDTWLIGGLRARPRRHRLEEILFPRREAAGFVVRLVEHVEELEAELSGLRSVLPVGAEPVCGHLLFVGTPTGYAIVESDEPPPPKQQLLLLDHGCYRVLRTGRSPFPGDRRPCLYLELSA
jgi:hypothetical protein